MGSLDAYFKGLSDTTRLRIINLLTWGELCGCDIQRVMRASQPNISRHLTYLKHAGLVTDRREGFRVFYRLAPANDDTLKNLLQFLTLALRREGDFRNDLRRLKDAIKDGACVVPPTKIASRRPAPAKPTHTSARTRQARSGQASETSGAAPNY